MHPELITLPGGFSIKTYGFFLMIGFLTAVWLGMRRAAKVKADPDVVLDLSFLALLFGVAGARLFYVVHYWPTQFAGRGFLAIVNITQGGLEFLGGFLGGVSAVIVYCWWKQVSLRLYLDIMAPSTMWGLAFGRIGCFFNGCCFGGICLTAGHTVAHPWAVRFPYASPPQWRQWENREVSVPAELVIARKGETGIQPSLIPDSQLAMSVERRQAPLIKVRDLQDAYDRAKKDDPESDTTKRLAEELKGARRKMEEHRAELYALMWGQGFPSRENPERSTSVSELQQLASSARSLPVHPTQLYASVHALLLSFVLAAMFYLRKRHGVVAGALLVMYPIPRALLEIIRADNPSDVAGLTASQFVSLCILLTGVAYLIVLYKKLPERSPLLEAAN
jgi:phosphatidylglycerol:prolipoprotein diacylglycerol transferase